MNVWRIDREVLVDLVLKAIKSYHCGKKAEQLALLRALFDNRGNAWFTERAALVDSIINPTRSYVREVVNHYLDHLETEKSEGVARARRANKRKRKRNANKAID